MSDQTPDHGSPSTQLSIDRPTPNGDLGVHEVALADVRNALAKLNTVPAAALSTSQQEELTTARDRLQSLERQLQNETEQLRGDE